MARHKTRGANLPVPQSREEAAEAVRVIGERNREIARIELDLSDRIAALKEAAERQAQPLREQAAGLTDGLKIWAEAHREALTGGKVKYADLGTGKVSWRFRPASVRLTKVEAVIEQLKRLGLQRLIRVREEPNKEAMLADPDTARAVAGVSIASEGEDFIVKPYEAEISRLPAA